MDSNPNFGGDIMRRFLPAVLILLLSAPSFAAEAPKTEQEKTLYALGLLVSRSLAPFQLNAAELEFVKQGITDGVTGKAPAVDVNAYNAKVQELAKTRRKAQGEKMASLNKAVEEKAAREKGAVKTASGMVYLSLKEGTGPSPGPGDKVTVQYRGTLPDGKEFDSSYKRGTPAEFRLDKVIKCFGEGLQMMKVGGKARLVCPSKIAYGERGAGDLIPPGATLVFEVELLGIKE
jgi:FKBP-type peptidyl-prolyl cis-trans isomerase FkpA